MNTKGIELAISNMVILILMIVTFIGAVTLTFRMYKGAQEIGENIDQQTSRELQQLLLSGNDLVAMYPTRVETSWNQPITVGIGIRNIGQQGTFTTKIEFSSAYDTQEKPIQNTDKEYIEQHWLGNLAVLPALTLKTNDATYQGIRIAPQGNIAQDTSSPHATYLFNVCIYKKPVPDAPCQLTNDRTQLNAFYDKQIHQVSITT